MKRIASISTLALVTVGLIALPSLAMAQAAATLSPEGIQRLKTSTDGAALVSSHWATGAARFVRLDKNFADVKSLLPAAAKDATPQTQSQLFFQRHGEIFGIRSASQELRLEKQHTDARGETHLSYTQIYQGVPVFGSFIKTHFDADNNLKVVNGTFVPNIALSTSPVWNAAAAGERAQATVRDQKGDVQGLAVVDSRLIVFRAGLVKGVEGSNHLAYEVEVGNNDDVREFVYVSAKTRKALDQITGIYHALDRRAWNTEAGYPRNAPDWAEGDTFPTGDTEADNVIAGAGESYWFFMNTFGFDSWDGAGGVMDMVYNDTFGGGCPNAFWNGSRTGFCTGVSGDDTVAHEWGHAYTDGTHNLIYQWQSGALNESASDFWGESVDNINGRGLDNPNVPRTDGACSIYGGAPLPDFTVNSPPGIAGTYGATSTSLGPPLPYSVTADMAIANPPDACTAVTGVAGKIAIIDWDGTGCASSPTKTTNAFNAGAVGVVIVADPSGLIGLLGSSSIATVQISNADGTLIKNNLPGNATIARDAGTDDSYRWISGESDPGFGGAIRDMWNPSCFGDPGKVTDTLGYVCSTSDSGGVHTNSGVPNHAFALVVDGGTYNGQTIAAIGLTKAVHIYWRAQSVYQVPTTNFPDHADALAQSCQDLKGQPLTVPSTDAPPGVGGVINQEDCDQVDKAIAAVEFHTPPSFCNFQTMLDPNTPDICVDATPFEQYDFSDDLDTDPAGTWTLANMGVFAEYVPRDWEWTNQLPGGGNGSAWFGIDSIDIGDCVPGSDDQAGVMMATSPVIAVNSDAPWLRFRHYNATETLWDGGNVKVRINGGAWQIVPSGAITFNPYPGSLNTAGQGNDNPMAGEEAYTGGDGGSNSGSWGHTIVDLSGFAGNGDNIEVRFDLGVDGCNGLIGWYVDDVDVLSCTNVNPSIFADGFESGDTTSWSITSP